MMGEERFGLGRMAAALPTKVTIVEDNEKIRDGLAALIGGSEGFQCSTPNTLWSIPGAVDFAVIER